MSAPPVSMTQPHVVQQLYQMLKDVHELFQSTGVEYWVSGGTLLGLVRHGGLIPWDDDLDVYCLAGQQGAITSLKTRLPALGYGLCPAWFGGFKVFPLDGTPIPRRDGAGTYPFRYPHLDIFLLELVDGLARYVSARARKQWRSHFHVCELYPLRLRPFGRLMVSSPCNPVPHLARLYGPDWDQVAAQWYDHARRRGVPRTEFALTRTLMAAALPAAPLQDRVAATAPAPGPDAPADLPATVCLSMVVCPGEEAGLAASLLSVVALIDAWVVVALDGVDPTAVQQEIDGIVSVQPGVLLRGLCDPMAARGAALDAALGRCRYALVLEPGAAVLGGLPSALSADEYTATTWRDGVARQRPLLVSSQVAWAWSGPRHGGMTCSSVLPGEAAHLIAPQNRTRTQLAAASVVPCVSGIPARSRL